MLGPTWWLITFSRPTSRKSRSSVLLFSKATMRYWDVFANKRGFDIFYEKTLKGYSWELIKDLHNFYIKSRVYSQHIFVLKLKLVDSSVSIFSPSCMNITGSQWRDRSKKAMHHLSSCKLAWYNFSSPQNEFLPLVPDWSMKIWQTSHTWDEAEGQQPSHCSNADVYPC